MNCVATGFISNVMGPVQIPVWNCLDFPFGPVHKYQHGMELRKQRSKTSLSYFLCICVLTYCSLNSAGTSFFVQFIHVLEH